MLEFSVICMKPLKCQCKPFCLSVCMYCVDTWQQSTASFCVLCSAKVIEWRIYSLFRSWSSTPIKIVFFTMDSSLYYYQVENVYCFALYCNYSSAYVHITIRVCLVSFCYHRYIVTVEFQSKFWERHFMLMYQQHYSMCINIYLIHSWI